MRTGVCVRALFALLVGASASFADTPDLGPVAADTVDVNTPTVASSVNKNDVHIGDRITLTINAVARTGVAVTLPSRQELGKFELLDRSDGEREGRDLGNGRRAFQYVLGLAAYEIGDFQLPALQLSYLSPSGELKNVTTQPIAITVRSLIGDDSIPPELQQSRPPHATWIEDRRALTALKWAGGGLVVLLVVLWIFRALRRFKRRVEIATEAEKVQRPPAEVAIERLAALRKEGNFSVDGYRPFSFAVAEVVRAYLGANYGFDSLEMTTSELIAELQQRAPLAVQLGSELMRFLEATDLIKFAKSGSSDEEAVALLDSAQVIVLTSPPVAQPAVLVTADGSEVVV